MPRPRRRLTVQKTYKLFIGGKFARGENGRVIAARDGQGNVLANYWRASRKDFRDAVRAARSAVAGWTKCSPYLRGQILYRAAENAGRAPTRVGKRARPRWQPGGEGAPRSHGRD